MDDILERLQEKIISVHRTGLDTYELCKTLNSAYEEIKRLRTYVTTLEKDLDQIRTLIPSDLFDQLTDD